MILQESIRYWMTLCEAKHPQVLDIKTRSSNEFTIRLYWNPSPQILLNITKRSKEKEMRGLVIDTNNTSGPVDVVFWDSWYAQHEYIANELHKQGYNISDDLSDINILIVVPFSDKYSYRPTVYFDERFANLPTLKRIVDSGLFVWGGV